MVLIVGESVACGNSIIDSAPDTGLQRMQVGTSSRFPVLCRCCTVNCLRKSRHAILCREVDFDGRCLDSFSHCGLDRCAGLLRALRLGERLWLSLELLWILWSALGRLVRNELLCSGRVQRLFDVRPGLLTLRSVFDLHSLRWNRLCSVRGRKLRRWKLRGRRDVIARADSERSMAEEEHLCGACSRRYRLRDRRRGKEAD